MSSPTHLLDVLGFFYGGETTLYPGVEVVFDVIGTKDVRADERPDPNPRCAST